MIRFKQFVGLLEQREANVNKPEKVAVFTTGRMNPPTIGHKLLADTVKRVKESRNADAAYLFPTMTFDGDKAGKVISRGRQKGELYEVKNPLQPQDKLKFIKRLIGDGGISIELNTNAVTALVDLVERGFTRVVYVAGSDYFDGGEGSDTRFVTEVLPKKAEEIGVQFESVSAGTRDANGRGLASVSATKARRAAMSSDENAIELFKQATGWTDDAIVEDLFVKVREGLGVVN